MSLHCLLLEHPRAESAPHYNDVANAPLSACLMSGSVAAVLAEHDFDVQIYDANLDGDTFDHCAARLRELQYGVLAVHAVYFWEHTPQLFALLAAARRAHPGALIVLLGFFPTFARRQIHALCPEVDAIIIGEPEITMLELVRACAAGGKKRLEKIAGLSLARGGEVVCTASRPVVDDIEQLPFPLRTARSLELLGGLILGSRGCYNRCSFCCIPPFYGAASAWRGRSPAHVAAEVDSLLPRLARPYVYFLDANFFAAGARGRWRALELARLLGERGLTFGLECRAVDVDPAVFAALADAGLRDVFLGIESASPNVLRRMQKGLQPENSSRAIAVLRSHGIDPTPGFIMFEADAALADVRINFDFLRRERLLEYLCTSANLLYHREIVLRSMARFGALEAQGRLSFADQLAYEGAYSFTDPGVQTLADGMSTVCRHILRMSSAESSPLSWKLGETTLAKRMNDYLVALFDELLVRIEKGEKINSSVWGRDVLSCIESMVRDEPVC